MVGFASCNFGGVSRRFGSARLKIKDIMGTSSRKQIIIILRNIRAAFLSLPGIFLIYSCDAKFHADLIVSAPPAITI